MNAEYGDITRTRPDDLRVNTSGFAAATAILPLHHPDSRCALGPDTSAGRQLIALDLILGQSKQAAAQHALTIFAAWIDGSGAADPHHAAGFMNVPVQAEQWLMCFDCPAHRL